MNTYQLDNYFELGQSDSEDNINSSQNDQIDTNIFNDLMPEINFSAKIFTNLKELNGSIQ